MFTHMKLQYAVLIDRFAAAWDDEAGKPDRLRLVVRKAFQSQLVGIQQHPDFSHLRTVGDMHLDDDVIMGIEHFRVKMMIQRLHFHLRNRFFLTRP